MKPIELINAITMVFPLISFIRNRPKIRKHTLFVKTVQFHIPVAGIYHISNSINSKNVFTRIFKFADMAFIHTTSFLLSYCTSSFLKTFRSIKAYFTIPINTLLVYRAVIKDVDNVIFRYFTLFYDNAHLLNNKRRFTAFALNLLLYQSSFKYDICHSFFHVALYIGYNEIFRVLGA